MGTWQRTQETLTITFVASSVVATCRTYDTNVGFDMEETLSGGLKRLRVTNVSIPEHVKAGLKPGHYVHRVNNDCHRFYDDPTHIRGMFEHKELWTQERLPITFWGGPDVNCTVSSALKYCGIKWNRNDPDDNLDKRISSDFVKNLQLYTFDTRDGKGIVKFEIKELQPLIGINPRETFELKLSELIYKKEQDAEKGRREAREKARAAKGALVVHVADGKPSEVKFTSTKRTKRTGATRETKRTRRLASRRKCDSPVLLRLLDEIRVANGLEPIRYAETSERDRALP